MSAARVSRPPLWRDVRVLRAGFQVAVLVVVVTLVWYLYLNLIGNLRRLGITTNYGFLDQSAGFAIVGSDFRSSQPVIDAIKVGVLNTALVSAIGIVLASIIGLLVGVARLSRNWLVRRAASLYVESLRNVPVLVIIIFMFTAVFLRLPPMSRAASGPGFVASNIGIWLPWFRTTAEGTLFWIVCGGAVVAGLVAAWWRTRRWEATGRPHHRVRWGAGVAAAVAAAGYLVLRGPVRLTLPSLEDGTVTGGIRMLENYAALLVALSIYTASHIAEIVRGAILAVPKGQTEAATALGLGSFQRLRFVVLPQALRVAVPPIGNQYLNLTKNSSLGVAIAFPEVTRVVLIVISQGGPAPQSIAILMAIYLAFSLTISAGTNLINRRLQPEGRR